MFNSLFHLYFIIRERVLFSLSKLISPFTYSIAWVAVGSLFSPRATGYTQIIFNLFNEDLKTECHLLTHCMHSRIIVSFVLNQLMAQKVLTFQSQGREF